ncbi:DUF2273 domain-containing protein [Sphaerospermopsis sp. LEGE 00249]|uniref:DUF2273 domain-containing protein n=1 Tax=Sphaerospermopsis sp. LEGE 00249 TaxID=1380707 RepID=UPI00164D3499|nr:DUF2273 domain-containing protein [Sphaerospermopsis sp. LEGE 00249]MBC5795198.1 DUF2273 domain-containing protein [Sphaerospermopsis sp. LEGE 00249]
MTANSLSLPQANLKIALWQIEADSMSSSDLYVWIANSGLPDDIAIRLHELASSTKKVGNKVISIGKIILIKIIEFIKAHPYLSTGVALGAAVGLLVNAIPFIGQFLAPLATVLGITIGAIAGHRLDKRRQGKEVYDVGILGITEEIIEIAKEFFQLLIEVFILVFQEITTT